MEGVQSLQQPQKKGEEKGCDSKGRLRRFLAEGGRGRGGGGVLCGDLFIAKRGKKGGERDHASITRCLGGGGVGGGGGGGGVGVRIRWKEGKNKGLCQGRSFTERW